MQDVFTVWRYDCDSRSLGASICPGIIFCQVLVQEVAFHSLNHSLKAHVPIYQLSRRFHFISFHSIPFHSLTHSLVHSFIRSFIPSNQDTAFFSQFSAKVRNAQECQDRCTVDNSCECVVWVLDGTQRLDPGLKNDDHLVVSCAAGKWLATKNI